MKFSDLKIDERILKAIKEKKYDEPSLIQQQAIPLVLEGRDVLGCAQTGSGKTAAFVLPMIDHLLRTNGGKEIKALVVTPTRELAIQIQDNAKQYAKYTSIKTGVIFGGVKEGSQKKMLEAGVDILICTPGRLLDFIGQQVADISKITFLVLDEADRMLDMGFIVDVRKILRYIPKKRQTLLFSATMPKEIEKLCQDLLTNPCSVKVAPPSTVVETIEQRLYFIDKNNKINLLYDLLMNEGIFSALVFTRTKHLADKVKKMLVQKGISCDSIHGDKSQNARQNALKDFKRGKIQALIATDIAARGIDIDYLSHVINYDMPEVSETYVHRVGRTARAGRDGVAISFCSFTEKPMIKQIEKDCKIEFTVIDNHPYPMVDFESKEQKANNNKSFKSQKNNKPKNEVSTKKPTSKNKFKSQNKQK